ncbi:hypothetical protein C7999DRAFT_17202 [Corynascus novoguineensis]|uniref:Uncharacterized protein n=1 Tax=Corynascus novoguineensis TaxID=1126955 RepID=A0AAN7CM10_9PEZI|nr:hypothetical protein C7999DRAFT_17202 [Corynascus novoguineensis]
MCPPTILLLSLTCVATGQSFTGNGQLRTLWDQGGHDDLGCLTEMGLWTSDNAFCGSFTGIRSMPATCRPSR